eukprot:m.9338 g.9338  ORF g.9338 m.9338 type:complete len:991 (+) comp21278_c0_seq1:40-3012(+)
MKLVLGVDVGGTNTDSVVLQGTVVIGSAKRPTSEDVTQGVAEAVTAAVNAAASKLDLTPTAVAANVSRVHIGTTHFVNATVQRKGLAPVAVFRLCGPATRALPPFIDFPPALAECIQGCYFFLDGGFEFDGRKIRDVDPAEVRACVGKLRQRRPECRNLVVSGVFSPLNESQERQVESIIKAEFPEASVTLSHQVGQTKLLERENAAILNECLRPLCQSTVASLRQALNNANLTCPFYLTQNDGTVISAARASHFPILTFASGPTNSMRGAAFLSGYDDAIVVDIGGTTTDVGMLRRGFPREASSQVKIGGVSANFRMPDVLSIGLGGGSLVDFAAIQIGPRSVGYEVTTKALVFGGSVLTGTDIAVAAGMAEIGDKEKVQSLDSNKVRLAASRMHEMVEEAVDQIKVSGADLPVVLVGGGSILIDNQRPFRGSSTVKKPPHYDVANAVGAALSQVGGSVDYVVSEDKTREEAHAEAKQRATHKAIEAGAQPETIQIVEVDEIPLSYLPGNAFRIKVKAVGDLAVDAPDIVPEPEPLAEVVQPQPVNAQASCPTLHLAQPVPESQVSESSRRNVDPATGEWTLSAYDVECIAVGAGILGCGGGGSPALGRLQALKSLANGRSIRIIDVDKLPKSALIAPIAFMGAPTICAEKVAGGREFHDGLAVIQSLLNAGFGGGNRCHPPPDGCEMAIHSPSDGIFAPSGEVPVISGSDARKVVCFVCCEIGGQNGMEPLIVGAEMGLPTVDADGMGRAFPELQMFSPAIYGANLGPCCLVSEKGECIPVTHAHKAKQLEDFMRDHTIRMGCTAALLFGPLTAADVKTKMICGSVTRACRLGDAVLMAQRQKTNAIKAILSCETGKLLIVGKIIDVFKTPQKGFTRGHVIVEGFHPFAGQTMEIALQNEFLVARLRDEDGSLGETMACVPDLITIIDSDTGYPISTEDVRYGLRVAVLVLAADPVMRTDRALQVVGPAAFGYDDVMYRPIADQEEVQ